MIVILLANGITHNLWKAQGKCLRLLWGVGHLVGISVLILKKSSLQTYRVVNCSFIEVQCEFGGSINSTRSCVRNIIILSSIQREVDYLWYDLVVREKWG